jgi:hypothetical protein
VSPSEPASEDDWPGYYGRDYRKHLHALGVVAISFATFQASLDTLYLRRAELLGLPEDFAKLCYYSLNDDKRLVVLKSIFSEESPRIISRIDNIVEFFQWCKDCRNNLLHAEPYPPGPSAIPHRLYLKKKVSRASAKDAYIKLSLQSVRLIADLIRSGSVQADHILLHLQYRDTPRESLPPSMRGLSRCPRFVYM